VLRDFSLFLLFLLVDFGEWSEIVLFDHLNLVVEAHEGSVGLGEVEDADLLVNSLDVHLEADREEVGLEVALELVETLGEFKVGHLVVLLKDAEEEKVKLTRLKEALVGLKAAVLQAKEAINPAKKAEREAAAERQAVYASASKVDKKHDAMLERMNSALSTLQSESYRADQVVEHYQKVKEKKAAKESSMQED